MWKSFKCFIVLFSLIAQIGCYNLDGMQGRTNKKMNNIRLSKNYKPKIKNLQLIATSQTPLYEKNTPRLNNIRKAANAINDIILVPNQEFSFNSIVGERSKNRGYQEAPILIRTKDGTKKGMGVGGGVCQVSSTIYKCAKNANLEIIERHPHSKKVFYTQVGDDATVAYPSADLKFKNNKSNDIVIKVEVLEDKIRVDILENR